MFKESGFNTPVLEQKTKNGTEAERKVLGFQDDEGYFFLKKDEKLEERIIELAGHLVDKGIVDAESDYKLGVAERSPGEKLEIAIKLVRERFFDIPFIKQLEDDKITVEGRDKYKEREISALIKEKYKMRTAAAQVKQVAEYNQRRNPEEYEKNIHTPFTQRLESSLRQRLAPKYKNVVIEYYPSIFENDALKTHLDGMRGADAFIIIGIPIEKDGIVVSLDRRVFFVDYTARPDKIRDKSILQRGMGVEKDTDGSLDPRDRKLRVYMEFNKVDDGANLAKMGDELAREIEGLI